MREAIRICPICEAACSLRVQLQVPEQTSQQTSEQQELRAPTLVVQCRGNDADTFSQGHICPKGAALGQLHNDPDRLRTPLVRDAAGDLIPASWHEAYARIADGLKGVRQRYGRDAVATYIGNPTAHNFGLSMGLGVFTRTLGSKNVFSAGSVDQLPKQLACELMYGNGMGIAVPDIERTDLLVILGANPIVSNGSLWVVPGIRRKLNALKRRGGQLIVIDPRRSETAKLANRHLFIKPGTDAVLLAAVCQRLIETGCSPRVPVLGFDVLKQHLKPFTVDRAAQQTGISADSIEQLVAALQKAPNAAVYGRVGTTLQRFGTLTSFLLDVVNLLTGNLDQPGGVMFPQQAFHTPSSGKREVAYARYCSRVSRYPEVLGQMPVACLAEEIETPGEGQIRALVTVAGNPLVSNPEPQRLAKALKQLEFSLAIDIYLNETSSTADVVLPGTSPFEDVHYDSFLGAMTYRNTARYSPALIKPADGQPDEWQLMLHLAYLVSHAKPANEQAFAEFEDQIMADMAQAYGAADVWVEDKTLHGVERVLDMGIRMGPWGDQYRGGEGLSLQALRNNPNSIDMGAIEPRLQEVITHPHGCIDLAPEVLMAEFSRLAVEPHTGLRLVGRRNIQTNNSWLHNLPLLSVGPDRAVLEMHPRDAEERQICDGSRVRIKSSAGELQVKVKLSSDLMPGTVVLPHGFSAEHNPHQQVARSGVNSNILAKAEDVDLPSATAALNGIEVNVTPAV